MKVLATDVEKSRRDARAALLERLTSHPWAVRCRDLVGAIVQAHERGANLREPVQALVAYCGRIYGAANSSLPARMSETESARLTGFQRTSTALGHVLGLLAGSEPVTDAQLVGALVGVEESLLELLLAWPRCADRSAGRGVLSEDVANKSLLAWQDFTPELLAQHATIDHP